MRTDSQQEQSMTSSPTRASRGEPGLGPGLAISHVDLTILNFNFLIRKWWIIIMPASLGGSGDERRSFIHPLFLAGH